MPRTTQKTSLVLLANAMLRASGTLAFIFVGRIKGPEDAGVLALSLGYLAIVTTLFLGLDDLLIREVTSEPRHVVKLVLAYSVLRLPLVVLSCGVVVALSRTANQLTASHLMAMHLIIASAILDGFAGLGQAVLYSFGGFKHLLYSAAVILLLRAGVGSLLLVTGGFLSAAVIWPISSLVGAVIVLLGAAQIVRESGIPLAPLAVEWPLVRHVAILMPSFGAVSLLSALEYQFDIILLSALKLPSDVAMYAAAASVINIVILIPQAYRAVLYPDLVRLHGERSGELRARVFRAVRTMTVLAILIAVGIALVASRLMVGVFGPKFFGSQPVLQVLIWNVVFLFVNVPLVRYLFAVGQQNSVARVLMISISINLGANLLLIPSLGAVGSAWARLASSAVFVVSVGVLALKRMRHAQCLESMEVEVLR